MDKKIKNFELVTLALYAIGGSGKYKGTEDIAVYADKIDNQRFRWKKYKQYIDRGLIFDCLKSAKNRKLGSFVKGNDEKGWMLTTDGLIFCKNSKEKFVKTVVRKKRISKVEKKYINREEYRILNTEAYNKFFNGKKELITENDIKFLFKVDDYSTKEDVEKRTLNLLENFKDNNNIFKLINTYKADIMRIV